jgi:hypothetical protein
MIINFLIYKQKTYLKRLQKLFDLKEIACSILDFGCWKLKFALLDVAFDIISNGIVKCK